MKFYDVFEDQMVYSRALAAIALLCETYSTIIAASRIGWFGISIADSAKG